MKQRQRYDMSKRALDVTVATLALLVTAPVIAVAAATIKLTSRGPVLYRAERVGLHGQAFTMFKLRTMHIDADHSEQHEFNRLELLGELDGLDEFSIEDDPRVTPIGRTIRRLSIDELSQLVNVLLGEMSLVGPRPSVDWEVDLFEPHFRQREEVLPGITGLWQVTGRRTIDMRGMLELDLEYVESRSFVGDLAILAKTIPAVIKTVGAS
jgi:lipopolysaccharide/colanic/teichoic acid biosynthesis glycosyltransferase